MPYTGPQLQQIQNTIKAGYTRDDFRRLVEANMAGVDFDEIAPEKGFDAQLWTFVQWANRHDRALELLRLAAEQSGTNKRLQALWQEAQAWDPKEASATDDDEPPAWQPAYRRYLERLIVGCNALPLAALGGDGGAGDEVTLERVYVDLDTATTRKLTAAEQTAAKAKGNLRDECPISALEAATTTRRMTLLGDPGSGKSTFAQHLAAWLAAAQLGHRPPPPDWPRDLTPIITVLRDVAPALATAYAPDQPDKQRQQALVAVLQTHWQGQLTASAAAVAWDGLLAALEHGRVLLVFDGLDEVA